ncbi:Hsp70 family protein [Geodermatophilus sp. SYSU D00804]
MRDGEYGLGIDIGDGTVAAAVCAEGAGAAEPLPLGGPGDPPVALAVDDDGVRLGDPVPGRAAGVLARVGAATPLHLGSGPVPAAAVVAGAVQLVRAAAAERLGRPDAWTVVTVPPSWAGHRRAALAAALQEAGVPRFTLVSAAVAAVARHTGTGELPERPTVAVYDLGAATVDLAVVGPDPGDPDAGLPRHLAPPPAPLGWGGRDVDDLLVGHVRGSSAGAPDPEAAAALRRACVAAKEALSEETATRVEVGPEAVRLTREELDELLDGPVRESAARLRAAVEAAGVDPAALDAVVLTGGGARMPLVAEVLSGELGRPLALGPAPELTAALGAAGLAAEALATEALAMEALATEDPAAGGTAADGVPTPAAVALHAAPPPAVPAGARRPVPGAPPRGPGGSRHPAAGPERTRARARRAQRGVLVGVLLLCLLVLPPAVAGLLGTSGTAAPGGEVPVAQAEDGAAPTGGSPGVAAPGAARPAGAAAPAGTARSAGGVRATDDPAASAGAVTAVPAVDPRTPGSTGAAGSSTAPRSPAGTPVAGTPTGGTTGGAPTGGTASGGDPTPGTTAPPAATPSGTAGPPSGPPPSGTPDETPSGTPSETPDETPTEDPTETPTETPGETPTEDPGTGGPAPDTTTPPAEGTTTTDDPETPAADTTGPAAPSPGTP